MSGVIPKVCHRHLDEVAAAGNMLRGAYASTSLTHRDLHAWEERLEVHLDALRVSGDGVLPIIEERLAKGEPDDLFSGVLTLAVIGSKPAIARIAEAMNSAQEPPQCTAIVAALTRCLPNELIPAIAKMYEGAAPPVSTMAVEVLANHRRLRNLPSRLPEYLRNENPNVRAAAWRIYGSVESELVGNTPLPQPRTR